jgi:hypothetical protein
MGIQKKCDGDRQRQQCYSGVENSADCRLPLLCVLTAWCTEGLTTDITNSCPLDKIPGLFTKMIIVF